MKRPTVPEKKTEYHHNDLRRALLDAAIVHLRDGEVTGLTMQSLARATGVSAGAPYHHFEDKATLLAALAEEGYAIWNTRAELVLRGIHDPREALAALGRAWIRFAENHPSHYRIMFLPDIADRERFASLHETSARGIVLLVSLVQQLLPDAEPQTVLGESIVAWSALHGFASLRSAGVLTNIPGMPKLPELESIAVEGLLSRFATHSPKPKRS